MNRRGVLAGALALLLAACGSGGGGEGKGITIGYQKGGTLLVARSRGVVSERLAKEGLGPVRWVEFPSGPPLVEAMRAGAVNFGHVGDTPVAYAQAAGLDIVYVATHSFPSEVGNALLVPKDSPIRTAADLKGKRLAFTKGSAAEVTAIIALKKVGLTLKDVTPVNLPPGDAVTAFANGAIDAWVTWDPYLTLTQDRVGGRIVPVDRGGLAATNFYIARGAWVKAHPQAVRSLLDALRDEAAWGDAHLDQVTPLFAAATRIPAPLQRRMFDRFTGTPFAVNPVAPAEIANQQRISDILFEAGAIGRKVDARAAAWTGWIPKR
ncbi:aliphatic sulfonate ABC transporter substrate-binding protein [uncultured Sphingomonas sp.]|uniref:aliphatic sulfonate ABC transporter substrate-binding protein n=1 Tax=uncultured Sphingomonas sp. TaxID=158754 RepID=UPI0025853B3F|nr:aliphatic sulfonate ABC transporter substrate-binding protein [uncultured Sphingomonas sp.]